MAGWCLAFQNRIHRELPPTGEGHTLTGAFSYYRGLHSRHLSHDRDLIVYTPPGYEANRHRHYPLLIMHDGQNLFDGATSFVKGMEWHLDETAQHLIEAGALEPVVIAGIYNTGDARIDEYSPSKDSSVNRGGQADEYAKLLIDDLLPFLHHEFRLRKGPANTGLGGSSLGGLVTMYLGLKHPDVFGKLAVMSPSLWWDRRMILKQVRELPHKLALKIWLDVGTSESGDPVSSARHVNNAEQMRDLLMSKGWIEGHDLVYYAAEGHDHSERSFGARADLMLRFLFGRDQ